MQARYHEAAGVESGANAPVAEAFTQALNSPSSSSSARGSATSVTPKLVPKIGPKGRRSPLTSRWARPATAAARTARSLSGRSTIRCRRIAVLASGVTLSAPRTKTQRFKPWSPLARRFRSASSIASGELRRVATPRLTSSTMPALTPLGVLAALKRMFASRKNSQRPLRLLFLRHVGGQALRQRGG